jgi:hypothetical protein
MYYGATRRREGLKAVMSIAAIAAGLMLSDLAASPALQIDAKTGDVVGVWRWVDPSGHQEAATPLLQIRRASDGDLEALVLIRPGDRARQADVSYDQGHLCMVTEHGASFKGRLSEDGSMIEGVIQFEGTRANALLQRVEHRKMRRAAGLRSYAT